MTANELIKELNTCISGLSGGDIPLRVEETPVKIKAVLDSNEDGLYIKLIFKKEE